MMDWAMGWISDWRCDDGCVADDGFQDSLIATAASTTTTVVYVLPTMRQHICRLSSAGRWFEHVRLFFEPTSLSFI